MLAHELRNPLAPIRNAVQVMAKPPAGDPAHDAMRETIDRQSAQLARIVDDMLDIARITRGELVIERAPLDLSGCRAARGRDRDARDRAAAAPRSRSSLPAEPHPGRRRRRIA